MLRDVATLDVDELTHELRLIEREQLRLTYKRDPVLWAQERLGDFLWSKQRDILHSLRDNRRTAVQSCHEIGKSYIAADAVAWWLDVHPPGEAFVVTSAPTAQQVRAILWREIGRCHARGKLRGRLNQTEWLMDMGQGKEELVAFGRKPDDYDPTAFQGIHARHVLYVFDEACGIPHMLWEAADSLIANDYSKAFAIGNPDDPLVEFAEICKPGSGWHVIQVGAFDSPNFTGEVIPDKLKDLLIGRTYVEEKRKKWAPDWYWSADGRTVVMPEGAKVTDTNPLWQSKVLGIFPPNSGPESLIPAEWIRAAMHRTLTPSSEARNELGVDVGGGGDSSCGAHNHGGRVRILWEDHNPDTMQTCGNVVQYLRETRATVAKIDMIGIGRGVVDRGVELQLSFEGVNVGDQPSDYEAREHFVNRRAELWWNVRELFEQGRIDIDPQDEDLAAELMSLRYKRTSAAKIQIESKDEARRRGVASPNRADAVMLALAPPFPELLC